MSKWLLRVAAGLSFVLLIGIIQDLGNANDASTELHASESVQVTPHTGEGSKEAGNQSSFLTATTPENESEGEEIATGAQPASVKKEVASVSKNPSGPSQSSEMATVQQEEAPAPNSSKESSKQDESGDASSESSSTAKPEPPTSSQKESQPEPTEDDSPESELDEEEDPEQENPVTTPAGPQLDEPTPNSIGLDGTYFAFVDMSGQEGSSSLQEAISKGKVVASTHSFSASDGNTTYFAGKNPGVFSHFAANLQMGELIEVMDAEGTLHTYQMTEQILTDVFGQAVIPSLGKPIAEVYINGSGEESILLQYENGDQLVVWYGVPVA